MGDQVDFELYVRSDGAVIERIRYLTRDLTDPDGPPSLHLRHVDVVQTYAEGRAPDALGSLRWLLTQLLTIPG